MNLRQHHEEARRRRLINRSVTQHRQIFFEAIRGSTVNYAAAPVRRCASRLQPGTQDIDDPAMTRVLQVGIVLAMVATVFVVRVPLMAVLTSLLS
ncbi:MAG: hypothetical protein NVS9B10_06070 [Nevskia sp.]